MATVEAASSALGPRYAPDDPTLPKPWKGLIDGSTGLTYYWNTETNVTQYEKPVSVPPSVPSGPQPVDTSQPAATPLAQTMQSKGVMPQHGQQISEASQHHQQFASQLPQHNQLQGPLAGQVSYQQPSEMPQAGQQGSHFGAFEQQYMPFGPGVSQGQMGQEAMQQGQLMQQQQRGPQMVHQTSQPAYPQAGSQMIQQPVQQMSQAPGPHSTPQQGPPMGQPQGHHYMPHQLQYTAYQQWIPPQGQQGAQRHPQHMPQGSPFSYQHENGNVPTRQDETKQTGFPGSQIEQTRSAPPQNLPSVSPSTHPLQPGVLSGQTQTFSSSMHMQQPAPPFQLQGRGNDMVHMPRGPTYHSQMGPSMIHGQQPGPSPVGSNMPFHENQQVRARQGYQMNVGEAASMVASQNRNHAATHMAGNQQDMRMGDPPMKNSQPARAGGSSAVAVHGLPNMYNHANADVPVTSNSMIGASHVSPAQPDVMNLTPADTYRQQHEVTATGENIPTPFMTFEATGFPPEILREIHSAGFTSPTPIQAQTWPIALQNRDIVAIAKTGSGKTLGYLMPAFIHLRRRRNNPVNGPTVLVLAPTRELATQIQDEAIKFGQSSRVSCTCLYGGAPKGPQLKELDRGADIVVATPGRLNDILEMKKIDFRQVSLLVLDEADRMLDMGFEPQIRKIVNEIPPHRQTLMYTATWPKAVMKIASDLLVNPVQVNIGSVDELAANKSITQYVELVPQMEKQRRLEQILRSQERGSKVLIFCSTKKMCDELTRSIRRIFPAAAIHGDKSQGERDWVLNQFRSGRSPILVATDVAARGLDIKDIRVVINYDFPTGIEDYVHRIGRTGRAGATGVAYTFFSEQDWKYAADLIKVLEGANQHVPPEVREMAMRGGPSFVKDRGGSLNNFSSGGRWDSGERGGAGGMRDGGFGGRHDMRDGGSFGGRGDFRDRGFGGRGMRGGSIGGRGGRSGGPGGGFGGRFRDEHGPPERFNSRDGFGRGRGRGRGRFDNRRDVSGRRRGRSYSSSPERVRTWGYRRSESRSRSRSRSRSWSRSRSRSRSRSPRRSYSRRHSRSNERRSRWQDPAQNHMEKAELDASGKPETTSMPPAAASNHHKSADDAQNFQVQTEPGLSGMADQQDQSKAEVAGDGH